MNNIEHNIAKRGRIWTYLYSQHCTHRVNSVFEEREYKIQFINARENNIFWQGSILLHLSNIESSTKVAKEEGWGRYWIWRRRDRISASLLVFFFVWGLMLKKFRFFHFFNQNKIKFLHLTFFFTSLSVNDRWPWSFGAVENLLQMLQKATWLSVGEGSGNSNWEIWQMCFCHWK